MITHRRRSIAYPCIVENSSLLTCTPSSCTDHRVQPRTKIQCTHHVSLYRCTDRDAVCTAYTGHRRSVGSHLYSRGYVYAICSALSTRTHVDLKHQSHSSRLNGQVYTMYRLGAVLHMALEMPAAFIRPACTRAGYVQLEWNTRSQVGLAGCWSAHALAQLPRKRPNLSVQSNRMVISEWTGYG